jgi:hypothetical protein
LMSRRTNYLMNCVKAVSKHQEEITCQKEWWKKVNSTNNYIFCALQPSA